MATFSADNFTDTAGTNLTAHTSDVGAGAWSQLTGNTGTIVISNANRARNGTANTRAIYRKADTPADADYSVYATVHVITTDISRPGVCGRVAAAADTCYCFRLNNGTAGGAAATWNMFRRVAGAQTDLTGTNNVGVTISNGQAYAIELRMTGSSIQGYVDGVLTCDCTDSNITAAGFPGLYQIAVTASDSADIHIDTYFADDTPGGGGSSPSRAKSIYKPPTRIWSRRIGW